LTLHIQGNHMSLQLQLCNKKDFNPSISILPSDRIYFGEYPYRIDIDSPQHPHPDHDPIANWLVTDIMRQSGMYWKRERKSKYRRSIYLGDYQDVQWLTNWIDTGVTRILGPLSQKHVDLIQDDEIILRPALFYGKYNHRIELSFMYLRGNTDKKVIVKEIQDFVSANFTDYRWQHHSDTWYYNFLYCDSKEYEELKGYVAMSFGKHIRQTQSVSLLSEL